MEANFANEIEKNPQKHLTNRTSFTLVARKQTSTSTLAMYVHYEGIQSILKK